MTKTAKTVTNISKLSSTHISSPTSVTNIDVAILEKIECINPTEIVNIITDNIIRSNKFISELKWDASSRWSSCPCCHMRNSGQMAIEKAHPILGLPFDCQKNHQSNLRVRFPQFLLSFCAHLFSFIINYAEGRLLRFLRLRSETIRENVNEQILKVCP